MRAAGGSIPAIWRDLKSSQITSGSIWPFQIVSWEVKQINRLGRRISDWLGPLAHQRQREWPRPPLIFSLIGDFDTGRLHLPRDWITIYVQTPPISCPFSPLQWTLPRGGHGKDLKRLAHCTGQEKKHPSFNMGSICGNLVKSIGTFRRLPTHLIVKNMDNDGVERNKNVAENWVVVGS